MGNSKGLKLVCRDGSWQWAAWELTPVRSDGVTRYGMRTPCTLGDHWLALVSGRHGEFHASGDALRHGGAGRRGPRHLGASAGSVDRRVTGSGRLFDGAQERLHVEWDAEQPGAHAEDLLSVIRPLREIVRVEEDVAVASQRATLRLRRREHVHHPLFSGPVLQEGHHWTWMRAQERDSVVGAFCLEQSYPASRRPGAIASRRSPRLPSARSRS